MEQELFELTYPQKSIWLTEQFYTNTSIGNICGTFLIDQELNENALEEAINLFINKNDALRIKLKIVNNEPFQYIEEFKKIELKKNYFETENEFENYKTDFSKQIFSLLESPLYKFELFKFANGKGGFIAAFHHTIADAWSMKLLLNKIREYYSFIINNLSIEYVT